MRPVAPRHPTTAPASPRPPLRLSGPAHHLPASTLPSAASRTDFPSLDTSPSHNTPDSCASVRPASPRTSPPMPAHDSPTSQSMTSLHGIHLDTPTTRVVPPSLHSDTNRHQPTARSQGDDSSHRKTRHHVPVLPDWPRASRVSASHPDYPSPTHPYPTSIRHQQPQPPPRLLDACSFLGRVQES